MVALIWSMIIQFTQVPTLLSPLGLARKVAAALVIVLFSQAVFAADFTVTSPGFFYLINNSTNPTITLMRGQTYTFAINTTPGPFGHPFEIRSAGVVNNNITQGTITYTVPNVDSNYTYICSVHFFGGQILTVPPPPPTVRILSVGVSNNVVLRSTGTNGWSVNPEFSTNLTTTNWFALSVLSNRFQNGINETFCGRPPGSNLLFRIRSQQN